MANRCARWWSLSPVAALAVLSCSSQAADGGDGGTLSTFTPIVGGNFNNFCSWPSAEASAPNDASDGIHGLGPLRVFWNLAPPHGSQVFPAGTLIVKASEEANPTDRTIFAMAKVGGGYNAGGAVNWQWFSLKENADCSVVVLWMNTVPPPAETYAGQPVGDCNGCHMQVSDNDYVWDRALQLSAF